MTDLLQSEDSIRFSSVFNVIVYTRPFDQPDADWQEFDRGPGYFTVPAGNEVAIRIKSISNDDLGELVKELEPVKTLRFLDLAENRNVSNPGIVFLRALPQLTKLSLSSCSVTNTGLVPLKDLPNLVHLDLSYCNRLSDEAVKTLEGMRNITFVNVYRCLGISNAAFARVRRKNVTFERGR